MGTAVLRTLASGSGIALTYGGTDSEIVISSAGGSTVDAVANVGSGEGVWRDTLAGVASLRSLVAGTGLSIASTPNEITISSAGGATVDAVANVGAGAGLWRDTLAGVASLRSLVAGTGITLTQNANEISVSAIPVAPALRYTSLTWGGNVPIIDACWLTANGTPVSGCDITFTSNGRQRLPFASTLAYLAYDTQNAGPNSLFELIAETSPGVYYTILSSSLSWWGAPCGSGNAQNGSSFPIQSMPANTPMYFRQNSSITIAPQNCLFTLYFSY